jgi:hypothetical protein
MSRARHGYRRAARRFAASSAASILIALTGVAPATPATVLAAGDFQLLVTPSDQLLPPGGSVAFLVQVGSVGGFADEVTLTVGTLPSGVTYQLSDDTVTPPATVHLTLIAAEDAEVGQFPIVVRGTGGGITHEATGSVTVDFGLIPICYALVKGTVTDRETGLPIEGVRIATFGDVFTDADGHYSFDQVGLGTNNAPSTVQVFAGKDGYWSANSDPADFVCKQTTTVDFELLSWVPGAVHGRIVEGSVDPNDPDVVIPGQTPIGGIQVAFEVSGIPGSGPDTTGADGAFQVGLDHLGVENTPLSLTLRAAEEVNFTDEVYWPRTQHTPSPILTGEVTPGDDLPLGDIGMVRKCFGTISGTVRYGDTLDPVVGATVQAGHLWHFDNAVADADGHYTITKFALYYNNQPTNITVSASTTGGFYGSRDETTRFDTCNEDDVVNIDLPRVDLGSVRGTVTDQETGLPLPGAAVDFGSSCPTCTPYPGIADANGDYRIDQIPAPAPPTKVDQFIEASLDGYWLSTDSFELSAGGLDTQDFKLLRKKFASLRGVVTDAITGLAIEGATGGATHATVVATTDAQGRYSQSNLGVNDRNTPLDGAVTFGAAGYWPAQVPATFEADKETIANLELIPICEGATIRGRVVDATNQQPLEGAEVVVIGNGNDFTDGNGRYEITGVRVGTDNSPTSVQVIAHKDGYFDQSKTITVFCGASISIDFGRRPPHAGALEGFVTNAVTGDPIPDVTIVGAFGEEMTTDGDGHYLFPEVPVNDDGSPKAWDVSAIPDGFPLQTKSVTVRVDETARLDFQFGGVQPPATGNIVVKVVTQPAGTSQSFSFTPSYGAPFNLADGGSNDSGPLEAGKTYSVSQTVPDGWDMTASCDQGQTPASIALAADTTVTCTFTDVQRGTIVIQKTAAGGDGTFAFTSQTLGNFSITTAAGTGSQTFANLVQGTFAIAETAQAGWDLASATCTGGSTPAAIALGPGQTVTCTFVNHKRGSAAVIKTVSGGPLSGTQSFAFELRQGASTTAAGTVLASGSATAGNGGSISFSPSLVAGATYQLCEVVMPGWSTSLGPNPFTLFNPSGDNSTVCADFTVQPGQARVLTIDNTPPPGGLTRTIGFWKNWSSCSKGKQAPVLDRTLAKSEPNGVTIGRLTLHGNASRPDVAPDCSKAFNLLDKTTIDGKKKSASDPAFNMAAQLLAAKLNVIAGAGTCSAASTAIADGHALLHAVEFNGLTHARLTPAQASQANALATTLDRYNNGLLC